MNQQIVRINYRNGEERFFGPFAGREAANKWVNRASTLVIDGLFFVEDLWEPADLDLKYGKE